MIHRLYKPILFPALFAGFTLSLCIPAEAENDNTQIGRYMTTENKPRAEQINLLAQVIQIRFPKDVQTIGGALTYLLKFSGYSLIPEAKQGAAIKTTLGKPLPAIDRNFGPMTLKDGLSVLAGPAFYLVQDPLNRMIDFRLLPSFEKLYETQNSSAEKTADPKDNKISKQDKK